MTNRLFLIDGHALIFKTYYAMMRHPLINSKGEDVTILYGFTKAILELIKKESPTHLALVFDPPGGSFRNKMYPEYKANRPAAPELVIAALEPLTEIAQTLGYKVLTIPGYEADDVIGTLATGLKSAETQVYMVTPDKDYGQLVGGNCFQYKSDTEVLGEQEICAKYGIQSPSQVIEMLTICGDTADNVPGVKGVGEVGASKLIAAWGSVENIYSNIDALTPRQKDQFLQAKDHIALSHELVTIKTDVPIDVRLDDLAVSASYSADAAALFDKYEFHTLKKYLGDVPQTKEVVHKAFDYKEVKPAEVITAAAESGILAICVDTDGNSIFSNVTSIGAAARKSTGDIVCTSLSSSDAKSVLENDGISKCGIDLKHSADVLAGMGITLSGKLLDISLLHYLLDPEKNHAADFLASQYLGVDLYETNKSELSLFDQETGRDLPREAAIALSLSEKISEEVKAAGLDDLYFTMEEPLLKVLSKMEVAGVKVDIGSLNDYAKGLKEEISRHESAVRELAEEPTLNVGSPKQIGSVIFEKLKLDPKAKKSAKGSWSTDESTLSALYDRHPIIGEILEFRAAKKLLSTYIEPFPGYVSPVTGRVHTTFNQALTATGRLSSSNPNLQNIPIRTERGREIRKAFVPGGPDNLILSADYSQIELRIMAHLCCDKHLVQAFRDGEDIHTATAAKIFDISPSEVTDAQRRTAKTTNFGIMYGISSFGLAQRLGVSRSEAADLIKDYFASFPAIRGFIDDTVTFARENGFVHTIFGRKRYLPDINSRNAVVRSLSERNAVNAPIQGSAADIIKLAMINVDRRMSSEGFKSRMVLQIHDELMFDAPKEEVEALQKVVKEEMENVIKLSVPLTVQCNYGSNWLEAH